MCKFTEYMNNQFDRNFNKRSYNTSYDQQMNYNKYNNIIYYNSSNSRNATTPEVIHLNNISQSYSQSCTKLSNN